MTTEAKERAADVKVLNHGSLHWVLPANDDARRWLQEHTAATWWGSGLLVEPRYTVDLLLGMQGDGFSVPLEPV